MLTIVGDVDPVLVVRDLKKIGKVPEIISVGPPKPPEYCEEFKFRECRPCPPSCKECQLIFTTYRYNDGRTCSILWELYWECLNLYLYISVLYILYQMSVLATWMHAVLACILMSVSSLPSAIYIHPHYDGWLCYIQWECNPACICVVSNVLSWCK